MRSFTCMWHPYSKVVQKMNTELHITNRRTECSICYELEFVYSSVVWQICWKSNELRSKNIALFRFQNTHEKSWKKWKKKFHLIFSSLNISYISKPIVHFFCATFDFLWRKKHFSVLVKHISIRSKYCLHLLIAHIIQ